MATLATLTLTTALTRALPVGDNYQTTPAIEFLVVSASGQWEPYLVVQADLSGWQMYEVEAA